MSKRTGPTNPLLQDLIKELKKKALEQKVNIWKRIAEDLERSTRQRRVVNIYRINKFTKDNETVIVPGKVLSVGELDHKVVVAAFSFSNSAFEKINKVGKAMPINKLIQESPKGKKIRIMG